MNLNFNSNIIENYYSNSQIARILTENWVSENMYCPRCGNIYIKHFENNRPVADFYCPYCKNEYELKSKNGSLGHKITDGAYETMIRRITSNENPDFFFMNYSREKLMVKDLILIPKHFFVPDIIEKRTPLKDSARRAGWIGCNILLDKVPKQGRISIISNGNISNIDTVVNKVNRSTKLETQNLNSRGWIIDILNCINKVEHEIFILDEIYAFENELKIKHPFNNNIKPKIRQQLQFLRDKGFLEFLGNGIYKKVN